MVQPGIFGVPLKQSIQYANVAISLIDGEGNSYVYGYVPIVVAKCGVFLKEKATNVEGIFRLSGSEKRIKELKTTFDSPTRYGKGLDWEGYTVHDAANVLRRYLNLLPEPIVPLHLYDRFREPLRQFLHNNAKEPQTDEEFQKTIETYQRLITELPPLNRQLLLYILDLLAVFASKSDENRMNSANLAAIFQPGMLSHPQHDMAPEEYRLSQDVLVFLIENQDHFLIGMRGTAADEQTVEEVKKGPSVPTTPSSKKTSVYRSVSNASAGADSLRRQGGVRRNVSVNSRMSHQSNGGSPASPALQPLSSSGNGVHRSNTVPSKRAVSHSVLQKSSPSQSHRQSPIAAKGKNFFSQTPPTAVDVPLQPEPVAVIATEPIKVEKQVEAVSAVEPVAPKVVEPPVQDVQEASTSKIIEGAITAPSDIKDNKSEGAQSQDALIPAQESPENNVLPITPTNEKTGFLRTLSVTDSEKRQPNKLRKRRTPSSQNPSAQSSATSLKVISSEASPAGQEKVVPQDQQEPEPFRLESIPSGQTLHAMSPGAVQAVATETSPPAGNAIAPAVSNTTATTPLTETEQEILPPNPAYLQGQYDGAVKAKDSANSLRSGDVSNDQSDLEHNEEGAVTSDGDAEKKEKRNRWRLSRRPKEDKASSKIPRRISPSSPSKLNIGSNNGAQISTTSFGSGNQSRIPRRSFQTETMPSMDQLTSEPSNGMSDVENRDAKKGPIGWIKNKMREAKEDKRGRDAEREREKAVRSGSEQGSAISDVGRTKSNELRRNTKGDVIPEVQERVSRTPLE